MRRRHGGDDLVDRLRRGDEQAWAAWYSELSGPVRGYLRSKGTRDPDDVLGDVFAAAAERIGAFDGDEEHLRSWLFTIAHHRLADDHRRRRRRPTDAVEPTVLAELHPPEEDFGEVTTDRIDAAGALTMLEWVTEEQREVLLLRIVGELSIAETAEIIGRKPGAVKALQHRALARIQRHLETEPYPIAPADDDSGENV